MKVIATILGLLSGAVVGSAFGAFFAVGLGYWSRLTHPNDPSAGSITVLGIITTPLGSVIGAVLGVQIAAKSPRLFCATILPCAILLIALQVTFSTLRGMDRPRHFELEVLGTPGAEYVGLLSIDGRLVKQKGTLPAKFECTGFRIKMAFGLVHMDEKNRILVNVSADGNDLKTGIESTTGVHQVLRSVGYSQTFGGTSRVWSRISEEEVNALVNDGVMPRATSSRSAGQRVGDKLLGQ